MISLKLTQDILLLEYFRLPFLDTSFPRRVGVSSVIEYNAGSTHRVPFRIHRLLSREEEQPKRTNASSPWIYV